jgi:DNA replication and repair protein RecF
LRKSLDHWQANMALNHLKIRNFRNLTSIDLDLDPGVNLFHGANAQGKTAILEAVNYLATSTSQRTRKDVEMIRWGRWRRMAVFRLGRTSPATRIRLGRDSKQFKVDGEVLKRISDLYGDCASSSLCPRTWRLSAAARPSAGDSST